MLAIPALLNPADIFGSADSARAVLYSHMATETDTEPARRTGRRTVSVTDVTVVGVLLSLVVLPGAIYGLLVLGWGEAVGLSNLGLGLLSMLPGVLLGGLSLLVMLGGD